MKPLVIYHDNCVDGIISGFLAWKVLGDDAEYLPGDYYKPNFAREVLDKAPGRQVYILDFSFPVKVMKELFCLAESVVWLDHHKTCFEDYCGGYTQGMVLEQNGSILDPVTIRLNDNKSGAMLTWEYFFHGEEQHLFVKLVDDYDRWIKKYPGTDSFNAVMRSYQPWSFEYLDLLLCDADGGFSDSKVDGLIEQGVHILRAQKAIVEKACASAKEVTFVVTDGDKIYPHVGLMVNSNCYPNEIGEALAKKSGTFGVIWHLKKNGSAKLAFRSNEYDVSSIAKAFGGGGHKTAASCVVPIEKIIKALSQEEV